MASDDEPEMLLPDGAVDGATDAAIIHGPVIVVSERVRDVFLQFDLGASEFLELPLYDADQSTTLDLPPRYALDVQETKDGFLPDHSKAGMIRNPATGELVVRWMLAEGDDAPVVVTVADLCAEGADVWGFANLKEVFVSDRLRRALDRLPAASGLLFEPCRVVSADGAALPQPSPWP